MAVFAIIPTNGETNLLDQAIEKDFAGESLKLPHGEWFVRFSGTSQELTDKLKISNKEVGSAVVLAISGYDGYARNNIWEWLESRWA
jgi:hypothetical protein